MNAQDKKQDERRMQANLRRGIEPTEFGANLTFRTLQRPNTAFFDVAFGDSPQKTFALPGAQQE